jgi:hypothetical protein
MGSELASLAETGALDVPGTRCGHSTDTLLVLAVRMMN